MRRSIYIKLQTTCLTPVAKDHSRGICKGLAYSLVPWYGIMSNGELWPPGALAALLTMVDKAGPPTSLLFALSTIYRQSSTEV